MKAIVSIMALMAVPALVASATAADTAALKDYLPTDGTMKAGVAVAPQFSPEFTQMQQALVEKLQALSPEQQKAFMESYDPMVLIAYNKDLWADKAAYDAYKAEWKKVKIAALREVAMGLRNDGNNRWGVLSLTADPQTRRSAPLTISALSYDSARNVWISNNGELTATDYQATEDHVYGAQTGTEWKLTKEDSLSKMSETVRFSRTTDGKAVYVSYSFDERSAISNSVIAQGGYVLMFPTQVNQVNMGSRGSR